MKILEGLLHPLGGGYHRGYGYADGISLLAMLFLIAVIAFVVHWCRKKSRNPH